MYATTTHEKSATSAAPVSDLDRHRVIHRMMRDHGMAEKRATAVFEETLRFLEACATDPKTRRTPSKEVDKGWHTFLLYTKAYRAFCARTGAGRFIDHEPNDIPGSKERREAATCFGHCGGRVAAADCYSGDCENPPAAMQ